MEGFNDQREGTLGKREKMLDKPEVWRRRKGRKGRRRKSWRRRRRGIKGNQVQRLSDFCVCANEGQLLLLSLMEEF